MRLEAGEGLRGTKPVERIVRKVDSCIRLAAGEFRGGHTLRIEPRPRLVPRFFGRDSLSLTFHDIMSYKIFVNENFLQINASNFFNLKFEEAVDVQCSIEYLWQGSRSQQWFIKPRKKFGRHRAIPHDRGNRERLRSLGNEKMD